ncbi:zinc-binding dehydrogenase [Streptomyces sp. NPDC054835]
MGTYAVQLAKAEGAAVMGVCSTGKTDLVRRLGADHVVDYTREEFAAVGSRHDLVLDIAGNRPLPLLLTALAPGGRLVLVLVGCEGGSRSSARCTGHCGPLRPERPADARTGATDRAADLRQLAGLAEAGTLRPVIDASFPLADAPEAIRRLEGGHGGGKLVVRIADVG